MRETVEGYQQAKRELPPKRIWRPGDFNASAVLVLNDWMAAESLGLTSPTALASMLAEQSGDQFEEVLWNLAAWASTHGPRLEDWAALWTGETVPRGGS